MRIIEAVDYKDMSRKAANIISAQVILTPESVLGLATGSTPMGTYQQLIEWNHKGDCDLSHVRTYNLDEYRGLAYDNPQSYHYFMQQHFFSKINIVQPIPMCPMAQILTLNAACAATIR
jgi:glucosamine-6-phosphate deaminase